MPPSILKILDVGGFEPGLRVLREDGGGARRIPRVPGQEVAREKFLRGEPGGSVRAGRERRQGCPLSD